VLIRTGANVAQVRDERMMVGVVHRSGAGIVRQLVVLIRTGANVGRWMAAGDSCCEGIVAHRGDGSEAAVARSGALVLRRKMLVMRDAQYIVQRNRRREGVAQRDGRREGTVVHWSDVVVQRALLLLRDSGAVVLRRRLLLMHDVLLRDVSRRESDGGVRSKDSMDRAGTIVMEKRVHLMRERRERRHCWSLRRGQERGRRRRDGRKFHVIMR